MKNHKLAVLTVMGMLLAVAAWAREDRLINTGAAPAASGKVKTDTDRNGNTEVEIEVEHLAAPRSLTPPRQGYFVWVQPRGETAQLLGALRVNSDLEGSVKGITLLKNFDVLITAEDQPNPSAPSSSVILKGTVNRK